MLEVTIQSKETHKGYEISSAIKGDATTLELKGIIKAMLKGIVDTTDEVIVISALEEYAKERLGMKE